MSFIPQPDKKKLFAAQGRTKQSFKKECDINRIMAKYLKTGEISPKAISQRTAVFADVSNVGDYQAGMEQIKEADEAFNGLPAKIRARFNNNPGELLDFCADPDNKPEAIDLGIIPKPPPEPPAPEPPNPTVDPKP